MKTAIVLLLALAACPTRAAIISCWVSKGHEMMTVSQQPALMDFPCQYNFIRQDCQSYLVNITVGNVYRDDHYFINTYVMSVKNRHDDGFWEGRSTNRMMMQFLRREVEFPFIQTGGNLGTEYMFNFERLTIDYSVYDAVNDTDFVRVYIKVRNRNFILSIIPYLPSIEKHDSVAFTFGCYRPSNQPTAFPGQICGGRNASEVKAEARRLGFIEKGIYNDTARDKTIYYHVFTDSTTEQSDEPTCGAVVNTMNKVCADDAKRVEAISLCYRILYSDTHRNCVIKYSCKLIDVFYECVKFVCSGFMDKDACQALGEYTEMCPELPGLTDKVKECHDSSFIDLV